MSKIVKTTDFVGKYSISQNSFNTTDLQAFIDKYEKVYLRDLLGLTLGDLLYTDIASVTFLPPVTARFTVIFNAIAQEINGCDVISNGIKEMLLGFIYWEFVKTQSVHNTITGNMIAENEVSSQANWNLTEIYNNYNESIDSYRAIQIYINENSVTYPEYNGKMKVKAHWSI